MTPAKEGCRERLLEPFIENTPVVESIQCVPGSLVSESPRRSPVQQSVEPHDLPDNRGFSHCSYPRDGRSLRSCIAAGSSAM